MAGYWRNAGSQRLAHNSDMGNSAAFDTARMHRAGTSAHSYTFGGVAEQGVGPVPSNVGVPQKPAMVRHKFLESETKSGPVVTPRKLKAASGFDYEGPWIPTSRTRNADVATFWDKSENNSYEPQRAQKYTARMNKEKGAMGSIDLAAADRSTEVFTAGVCATEINKTGALIERHWGMQRPQTSSAVQRRDHNNVTGMSSRGTGMPATMSGGGPREYQQSRADARRNKVLGLQSSVPIGIGRKTDRPVSAW